MKPFLQMLLLKTVSVLRLKNQEVFHIIMKLKADTAVGFDGFTATIFKQVIELVSYRIVYSITYIYNLSLIMVFSLKYGN